MIEYLDGRVILHPGDCIDVLASLPENSVDAVVCDPPYHLHSITKRFAKTGRTDKTRTKSGPHQRTARGFMNKLWDGGDVAFRVETWEAVFRVLKPGGYLLAFASTRGFGRMSVAIEDAGFITHPMIAWIFGSGFPKAHNAARAIDKELGREGEIEANGKAVRRIRPGADQAKDGSWEKLEDRTYQPGAYQPSSEEAAEWQGWHYGGQSLKPAIEPIYMGQKPFTERNGAANLLFWRTGAVNIDGCRVGAPDGVPKFTHRGEAALNCYGDGKNGSNRTGEIDRTTGRWPANVIHDGSDEVLACFPNIDGQIGGNNDPNGSMGYHGGANGISRPGIKDSGSAGRFFYSAKADSEDRIGSKHPTVKPVDLMQYLVRLVTPPGGTVLDPFAGTGTTGEAAWREGVKAILIEREPEYQTDIAERMRLCLAGPDEKRREIIKRAGKAEADAGPLFGGDS
ncbi:site-specific DNA-methyltransferase [Sinorhizobium meliloti]|nr:site-specific DNA-methyltransferase [Sinorhizobium meliloti]